MCVYICTYIYVYEALSHLSGVRLFAIKQGYWSGLPCPPPGDLPDPGIEPKCLTSPALAGGFLTTSATWEAQ